MGIFNSKKTRVYSQAAHLMEVNPNADKDAVLYGIFKNQSIARSLVNSRLSALNVKVNQARKYAKNHYVLGLANDEQSKSGTVDDTVVADAITTDLSLPYGCLVLANESTSLSVLALVVPFLMDTRDFNPETNNIYTLPDDWTFPEHYLTKHVVIDVFVSDTYLDIVDEIEVVTVEYTAKMTYHHLTNDEGVMFFQDVPEEVYTPLYIETFPAPVGIRVGENYYIAAYQKKIDAEGTTESKVHWWYYNLSTGLYPELTPNLTEFETINAYPVIPIRYENEFMSESNEPDIYETGGKLLDRMGLDFDTIVTTMESNTEGIDEIDHAYVMFGVDLQTDNDIALGYLVEFFTYLVDISPISIWDRLEGIGHPSIKGENAYIFGSYTNISGADAETTNRPVPGEDDTVTSIVNPTEGLSLTEHGLNININYDYITSVILEGNIGEVGTVTKQVVKIDLGVISELNRQIAAPEDETAEDLRLAQKLLAIREGIILIFQQQLTPNAYREVLVKDLLHVNHIYRKKSVMTSPLHVDEDEDEHNLIIPLHHTVVKRLPLFDQSRLYEQSLILVMNSYVVTKLKWYETGIFKGIVAIIGAIITIWTGQAWVLNLVVAMEAGIAALFMFVMDAVVYAGAIQYVAQLAMDIIGPEIGFIIAIVLATYGYFKGGFTLGSVTATAETLLNVGMAGMKAAGDSFNDLILAVTDEYEDFLVESEEQIQELKDAQDLLTPEYMLPFSLLTPAFEYPEPDMKTKPETFYDSIHVGNVGTLSLDVVESYVNISLLLPEGA